MGLGICVSKCCIEPCDICTGSRVPNYVDMVIAGLADATIADTELCSLDGGGTRLVAPLSELNGTVRCELRPEWSHSGATGCCSAYYGEATLSTMLRQTLVNGVHYECNTDLTLYSNAYVNSLVIGYFVRVNGTSTPGEIHTDVTSIFYAPDVVTVGPNCFPVAGASGGVAKESAANDWFCTCTGDSGNLMTSPPLPFDPTLFFYSHNQYLNNHSDKASYVGTYTPTSIVLTASCTRVPLNP